ncbi:hypothetical protein V1504DRAFT_438007 [Lipomyces starkeyi]
MERDSYERALHFLKANKPEKRLDIDLSYESFRALEIQAQAKTQSMYPRLGYCAIDSRVTIHTALTALHSSAAVSLQDYIRDCLRDVLVRHGRQGVLDLLIPVGDTTYESADDQGRGTSKSPDNGFKYKIVGRCAELIFVIEVGVSEGYRALVADIMLWLNQFHCRTAILLLFKEQQSFRYPRNSDAYSVSDLPAFQAAMEQAESAHPYGPYCFREHAWFGTMDTAIIEVFKRNPTSGTITTEKKCTLVNGGHMVIQADRLDLGLSLGDFFPPDEERVADIQTAPIRPRTESLRLVLASGAEDTARARFARFMRRQE